MKTMFKILLSGIFITAFFSCKDQDNRVPTPAKPSVKGATAVAETYYPIMGSLKIQSNKIQGKIYIPVYDGQFTDPRVALTLSSGQFKGLVVMFTDTAPGCHDGEVVKPFEVLVDVDLPPGWQPGDIRVMALNESNEAEFRNVKGYFELRLATFGYGPLDDARLDQIRATWNSSANGDSQIYYNCPNKEKAMPRFSKKTDGILTLTN